MEVAIASKAIKIAVRGNMHIDTRVIEVTDFKIEVKFDFRGHGGLFLFYMFSKRLLQAI